MKTNAGNDQQAGQMGDPTQVTATMSSATSTTITATGTPFPASPALVGHIVAVGGVYGYIVSHTTSVLTVDKWYNPSTPGGTTAGSIPTGTPGFVVLPGQAAAYFMGLDTSNTAPAAGDTALGSEYATTAGGLYRKAAGYTHTTSAAGYTLTATFTANGSDSGLPVTVYSDGIFQRAQGGAPLFHTTLSAAATINASGDQLTITHSVTN